MRYASITPESRRAAGRTGRNEPEELGHDDYSPSLARFRYPMITSRINATPFATSRGINARTLITRLQIDQGEDLSPLHRPFFATRFSLPPLPALHPVANFSPLSRITVRVIKVIA